MAEYRTVTRVATLSDNICKVNGISQNVIVVDPYIEIEQTDEGAVITVTDAHQTTQATIYNGPPGPVGPGVPTGGSTGQVLTKVSGTNYDLAWTTPSGGGGSLPSGGTAGQFLKKNSATEGDAGWSDLPIEVIKVTVSLNGNIYSSDTEFDDIYNAIVAGKDIYVTYNGNIYNLDSYTSGYVHFVRYYLVSDTLLYRYRINIYKQTTSTLVSYETTGLQVPTVPSPIDPNATITLEDDGNNGYYIDCGIRDMGYFFENSGEVDRASVTLIYNKQWYDTTVPTNGSSESYVLVDKYTTNEYDSEIGDYIFTGYLVFEAIVKENNQKILKTIVISDPMWQKDDNLSTATVTYTQETINGGSGSSNVIVVNISNSGGVYTADKTYAELYYALTNGIAVIAIYGSIMLPAFKCVLNEIVFYQEMWDSGTGAYYNKIVINSNDVITHTLGQVPSLPVVSVVDNGKFLRVVSGHWSVAELSSANGVSF